ncbi:hypothetical protein HZS_2345, partial [Henneguya salminicola]
MSAQILCKELEVLMTKITSTNNFKSWIMLNETLFVKKISLDKITSNVSNSDEEFIKKRLDKSISLQDVVIPIFWTELGSSAVFSATFFFFLTLETCSNISSSDLVSLDYPKSHLFFPSLSIKLSDSDEKITLAVYFAWFKNTHIEKFELRKKSGKIDRLIFDFALYSRAVLEIRNIKSNMDPPMILNLKTLEKIMQDFYSDRNRLTSPIIEQTYSFAKSTVKSCRYGSCNLFLVINARKKYDYFSGSFSLSGGEHYNSAAFTRDKILFGSSTNLFLSDVQKTREVNTLFLEKIQKKPSLLIKNFLNEEIIVCNFPNNATKKVFSRYFK